MAQLDAADADATAELVDNFDQRCDSFHTDGVETASEAPGVAPQLL